MKKDEYPLEIANQLGIPPVMGPAGPWMSNQGTVMKDWLLAVGEALDVPYEGRKTLVMQALVESVGQTWDSASMSSDESESGGQGNITVAGFEALLRGLTQVKIARGYATARGEAGSFRPAVRPSATEDRSTMKAIRVRAGQPAFRAGLLEEYRGQCAVTGCDAVAALEAAHVVPYGAGGSYDLSNGLLLRADLHTLFDLGLVGFDADRRLILGETVRDSVYGDLVGVRIALTIHESARVPDESLEAHRRAAGLT